MPHITGQIEAISLKPMPSPDQYGNTHRFSFKLGDDWYSAGSTRGGAYVNKAVPQLETGMLVEFMYEINGTFKNIKRPTLAVSATPSSAGAPPPPAGHVPTTEVRQPAVSSSVGMGVGMAINNACLLYAHGSIPWSEVEPKACEIYQLAERLKSNAAKGNIAADLEPVQQPYGGHDEMSMAGQSEGMPDDDIPF